MQNVEKEFVPMALRALLGWNQILMVKLWSIQLLLSLSLSL
jgi:hypothetical protein